MKKKTEKQTKKKEKKKNKHGESVRLTKREMYFKK